MVLERFRLFLIKLFYCESNLEFAFFFFTPSPLSSALCFPHYFLSFHSLRRSSPSQSSTLSLSFPLRHFGRRFSCRIFFRNSNLIHNRNNVYFNGRKCSAQTWRERERGMRVHNKYPPNGNAEFDAFHFSLLRILSPFSSLTKSDGSVCARPRHRHRPAEPERKV